MVIHSRKKNTAIWFLPVTVFLVAFVGGCGGAPENQTVGLSNAEAEPEQPAAERRAIPIPRLEVGDIVPGFQLVDQEGDPFSVSDFRGDVLAITFIFTRCLVPDFCPLMANQFQEIQEAASGNEALKDRFQLLSVTIDPEFDQPEVLAAYGRHFTDDFSTWTFATGSPDRIDEVTTRFSVYIEDNEEAGTIDHALATALIDPEGRVVQIWRGNGWEPAEVLAAMEEIANTGLEE